MDEKQGAEQAQPKLRSPNYPVFPLDKAIDIARKLHEKYYRAAVPMPVAMTYLGYSAKSSSGLQVTAALLAYGLIIAEGSGKGKRIKISDLAFTILKSPNQTERETAIKCAAMNPSIFKGMMEKYGNQIPDENILKYDLEADKDLKFNPKSIPGFIDAFLGTISFAKISEYDIICEPEGQINTDIGDNKMMNTGKTPPPDGQGGRILPPPALSAKDRVLATYTIGRGSDLRIVISGQRTTKESIDKFFKRLQEDKEYLIEDITTEEKADPTKN